MLAFAAIMFDIEIHHYNKFRSQSEFEKVAKEFHLNVLGLNGNFIFKD